MAGTKIPNAAYLDNDWQSEIKSKNLLKRGWFNLNFTHMDDTSLPTIAANSTVDIDGTLYEFESEEIPSGSTGGGPVFIKVVGGATATVELTSDSAYTYDYEKKGYYNVAGERYVLRMFKSAIGYTEKYVMNQQLENEFALESLYRGLRANTNHSLLNLEGKEPIKVSTTVAGRAYSNIHAVAAAKTTVSDGNYTKIGQDQIVTGAGFANGFFHKDINGAFQQVGSGSNVRGVQYNGETFSVVCSDGETYGSDAGSGGNSFTATQVLSRSGSNTYRDMLWVESFGLFLAIALAEGSTTVDIARSPTGAPGAADWTVTAHTLLDFGSNTGVRLYYSTLLDRAFILSYSTGSVAYSDDGITWSTTTISSDGIVCMGEGGGLLMVTTDTGEALTSTDGLVWTSRGTAPIPPAFTFVIYNGMIAYSEGTFIMAMLAIGNDIGAIHVFKSTDSGDTWALVHQMTSNIYDGSAYFPIFLKYVGDTFILVGSNYVESGPTNSSHILSVSSDGDDWTAQSAGAFTQIHGAAYTKTRFYISGYSTDVDDTEVYSLPFIGE